MYSFVHEQLARRGLGVHGISNRAHRDVEFLSGNTWSRPDRGTCLAGVEWETCGDVGPFAPPKVS